MPRLVHALAAAIVLASFGPAVAAPAPDPFAAALSEGDAAFARRSDPARLAAALAAYRRAQALRPGAPDVELRLARAEAFRARAAEAGANAGGANARAANPGAANARAAGAVTMGAAEARGAWEAAARAGERALRTTAPAWARAIDAGEAPAAAAARVERNGAEALYWLALGSMRAAQATGYAAVLAVKDATLGMMDRVVALDEGLDAAGPHRALGGWRAALPIAAGGGPTRALAHFDRARALAPGDGLWRVVEAETYAVLVQDAARFDRLLEEVNRLQLARWPERAPENALAQRRAKALRAKRARLF